ncbi:acyl-CoA thioesterase II [Cryptococcus sp. DSM 104549]
MSQPPNNPLAKSLVSLIKVEPHPSDPLIFLSGADSSVPPGKRGAYGGLLLCQALRSASYSIPPPLGLHSAHCYFLHPGRIDHQIEYHVENLSDGKSFANRLVKVKQDGKVICVVTASWTRPPVPLPEGVFAKDEGDAADQGGAVKESNSLTMMVQAWEDNKEKSRQEVGKDGSRAPPVEAFEVPFPKYLLPWDQTPIDRQTLQQLLDEKKGQELGWKEQYWKALVLYGDDAAFTTAAARRQPGAPYDPNYSHNGRPTTRMTWFGPRTSPDDEFDEETLKLMVAFTSDFHLGGTSSRSTGLNSNSTPTIAMLASLDHAIHFYPFPKDIDPHKPFLHVMEAQVANTAANRGMSRGRIYSTDGHLLAVTGQEALYRAQRPGAAPKGVAEAGLDAEDLGARL